MVGIKPIVRWSRRFVSAERGGIEAFEWSGKFNGLGWWETVQFVDEGKQPDGLEGYVLRRIERREHRCETA